MRLSRRQVTNSVLGVYSYMVTSPWVCVLPLFMSIVCFHIAAAKGLFGLLIHTPVHTICWAFQIFMSGLQSTQLSESAWPMQTSGIHGGYRLVSTYDLPDCQPMGGGEGGILEYTLVISNLKFFSLGRGYSGVNFGHLKSEVFQLRG